MLSYVIALILAVIVLLSVIARKSLYYLPAKELKRQAESGDALAATFWRAVAFGPSLRVFLWLVLGFASATSFLLLARVAPPIIGLIAISLLVWFSFAWLPAGKLNSFEIRITSALTPSIIWLVRLLDPVLRIIHRYSSRTPNHVHSGIYVRSDLLDLIKTQSTQPDNQLTAEELSMAGAALQFGQIKVRDIMKPRKSVKSVDVSEQVSPIFLSELHGTLHSRFPVTSGDNGFVGILHLKNLVTIEKGIGVKGTVQDYVEAGVIYVHERDSLADALHAFYLTKRTMFIVINTFEEYVGILTLEDILHSMLGDFKEHTFDQHESLTAVAKRHSKKPKHIDEHIDENPLDATNSATVPSTTDEVVK